MIDDTSGPREFRPVGIKPGMSDEAFRHAVYGMDMAAASGRAVLQGHADYCAAHGHATNTVNGELQPYCARCDALLATPENIDVSEFDVPSVAHDARVDEDDNGEGTMFRGFCSCGWSGSRWVHSDEFADNTDTHPDDAAHALAESEITEHLS